jgi:UDP-N-acetylglucosamine--N-acetylmuramyl-(pentapeptide) pyrophosphoryl-undecaprenol N-acetylglucosamine transferase
MPKVLIAAGGTGGHIFPAERLGSELKEKGVDVLFAGAGLSTNRYFDQSRFSYYEIALAKRKLGPILQGIYKSFKVIRQYRPDLVVGMGSFHSFPLLFAALIMRVPFVLFESNAHPGKVIRFFSKWAKVSAIHFKVAREQLSGPVTLVKMPRKAEQKVDTFLARQYFGLEEKKTTFLVFGGSQGSVFINHLFSEAIFPYRDKVQVIHLAGTKENADFLQKKYEEQRISACVKSFETRMDLAWSAADIAICRSGASTVAEQIAFGVLGLHIPWPKATDDHQTKNAECVKDMGGALVFQEKDLDILELQKGIEQILKHFPEMKASFAKAAINENKMDLSALVYNILKGNHG